MQSLLRGVRSNSRPGRVKLVTAGAALDKDEMLFLSSGARMGLDLVSAVEDVVTEEREVRALGKARTDFARSLQSGH